MDKKSVSITILVLFVAIFFSVIGICFSSFVFKDTRTLVKAIKIKTANGIGVYNDKELSQPSTSLKLSKMELGLKPATGEIDAETQIPSTIDDKGTSEGYYATIFVQTESNFKIIIDNIEIESRHNPALVNDEKKNIFVGIMDMKDSVTTLESNGTEIARFSDITQPQEITFLIWLGSMASDELEGANISFDLVFSLF